MTRHVTVGLDGSPESRAAAAWAAEEALLREVPLHLVHAEEWPTTAAIPMVGPEVQQRWADKVLADAADELRQRHPGLEITTRRLSGRPAAALPIEAGDAEMLVLGSRGLGSIMGFLIGSAGMATVSATERPVVLVRAPKHHDKEPRTGSGDAEHTDTPSVYRDVVVGLDIHQSCDKLLAFAFDEAARRGCTLHAVHGWTLPLVFSYAPMLDPGIQLEVGRQVEHALSDMLLPWRHKFPSVQVVERAPIGSPAQQLVYSAADADLVVVGRRLRRAPLGAHIGHVAHAVMHHSAAPVAVVPHD
ncbi:nucleotide-binding universal stress UspA family protein [Streptomyces sp. SLBN-118]|uniref:universal stress protein n=1 Tax=Streptomyces sp. SLBN-118 TaxID=2768454 RepID=UPI001166B4BD|nr:universal stress protein [Streptomyces sp. SLBN-118]TQK49998.1 nucleotide-binding universal stress UspA family protein [Streptomyces sp. SLBN-118]